MDALLLHCPSMASSPIPRMKRPCCSPSTDSLARVSYSSTSSIDHVDSLLESLLGLSDSSLPLLDYSLDRLLDSETCDFEKNHIIDRAHKLGSILIEASKRSTRKNASLHNAVVWALPFDLTVKVFSLLDTQTLCYAAAACSFFNKCAADPACYANIDLTSVIPKVNNAVVATMVHRAGRSFQSLKLGIVPGPIASAGSSQSLVYSRRNSADPSGFSCTDKRLRKGKESSVLTRSCLGALMVNDCSQGALLRKLHLYNIETLDNAALFAALSACPSLQDLQIVGLQVELRQTLESVSQWCPLITRLFFESSKTGRDDSLKLPACNEFVYNCPNLSTLALRGFKLPDYKARLLVKGFPKLKYVDFSTSYSITGAFLKSLGATGRESLLEVLILRDCMHLKEVEVTRLFSAVLSGDFKQLKYIDISNREGLASDGDWYRRCCSTSFIPVKRLQEKRPELVIVAEFPEESFIEVDQMIGSDINNDVWPSSSSSGTSSFMSSSDSFFSSDQSSGEDSQDTGLNIFSEESSDESDSVSG